MSLPVMYLMLVSGIACAVLAAMPLPETVRLPGAVGRRRHPWSAILAALGRALPQSGRSEEQLRERLIYTGSRLTVQIFRGIKVLLALGVAVAFAVAGREFGVVTPLSLAAAAAVGFIAPDLWLRARLARRQQAILHLLPEVVDLLSLCIGAGLDFQLALNRVIAIPQFHDEPLVEELSSALQEIKLGKRRSEALKTMAKRVNLMELSSFVRTIVQADRMGTPISEVLAIHAEDVRLQRWTLAERAALKAPIKILVPLIFCIMPCVAIIVGAPVFMQFMQQNPFGR